MHDLPSFVRDRWVWLQFTFNDCWSPRLHTYFDPIQYTLQAWKQLFVVIAYVFSEAVWLTGCSLSRVSSVHITKLRKKKRKTSHFCYISNTPKFELRRETTTDWSSLALLECPSLGDQTRKRLPKSSKGIHQQPWLGSARKQRCFKSTGVSWIELTGKKYKQKELNCVACEIMGTLSNGRGKVWKRVNGYTATEPSPMPFSFTNLRALAVWQLAV